MSLNLSGLYAVIGEALALYLRAAPRREIHLTPSGWLAASGEPCADLNLALVDTGSDAVEQLHTFHQTLQARNLPALYFLTSAVADQLATRPPRWG